MILVAGGTGRLGTLVVERLTDRGADVRVMTRDPRRAGHLTGTSAEVVVGDVRDRNAVSAAVAGVDTVVSAVQGFEGPGRVTPESVDHAGNVNLIDAASAVGADVVLMSIIGAAPDSPMELMRAKYRAEQHLRSSTTNWTIVRASAFVELWADITSKGVVLGHGENPINFVSVRDVAAVVERAVLTPEARGVVAQVGGPADLTFNELASALRHAGRVTGRVRHVPRSILRCASLVSRRARAAVAMDTIDLRFDAAPERVGVADVPMTDISEVLALGRELPLRGD